MLLVGFVLLHLTSQVFHLDSHFVIHFFDAILEGLFVLLRFGQLNLNIAKRLLELFRLSLCHS